MFVDFRDRLGGDTRLGLLRDDLTDSPYLAPHEPSLSAGHTLVPGYRAQRPRGDGSGAGGMRRGGDPSGCSSQAWHDPVSQGNNIKVQGTPPPSLSFTSGRTRDTAERATHDRLSMQSGTAMHSDVVFGASVGSFHLASALIASGQRSCARVIRVIDCPVVLFEHEEPGGTKRLL